jgi:hypothetical protein
MHKVRQVLNNTPRLEADREEAVSGQKEDQQTKLEAVVPPQEMVKEGGQ